LVYAAVWAIGEFGDILVNEVLPADEDSPAIKVTETEVVEVLESIISSPFTTFSGREYTLTAMMKLTGRFQQTVDRLQKTLRAHADNINVELQQRAVEYIKLFSFPQIKTALFERIPAPEPRTLRRTGDASAAGAAQEEGKDSPAPPATLGNIGQPSISAPAQTQQKSGGGNLLDLDLLGDAVPATKPGMASQGGDLLSDLLGLGGSAPAPASKPATSGGLLDDLGLGLGGLSMSAPIVPQNPTYEKNGIRIVFESQVDVTNPTLLNIKVVFTNTTQVVFSDLNFQAAVPKTLKIQMQPPSSTMIQPFGTAFQLVRVANTTHEKVRLRIRIAYAAGASRIEDMADVDGFPNM